MSEQRTVGSLTADDLGSVVRCAGGLGDQRGLALLSVNHRRGQTEVFWEYDDGSMASGSGLDADTPCTVTPGGPQ